MAVAIPSIGVRSRLVGLGLNGDGTLQVPGTWNEAGWYRGSSVPGAPGPAVIVGHVDSNRGPAVFFQLRSLQPGALVVVRLSDGSSARYRVNRLALFPKAAFPTRAVYGPTRRATLRLITCGGPFDFATGHYLDNLVVFAGPAGSA